MRLLLAALLVLAFSGPILNPSTGKADGSTPTAVADEAALLIVLDDGWQAASRWDVRIAELDRLLATAARQQRPVLWLRTAPPINGWPQDKDGNGDGEGKSISIEPQAASDLRAALPGITPRPWAPDHRHLARILESIDRPIAQSIWISDGLDHPGSDALLSRLEDRGPLRIFTDQPADYPLALSPLRSTGSGMATTIKRPSRPTPAGAILEARGADGRLLAQISALFAANETTAEATFDLPREIRNQVARIDIADEQSAGATILLDGRSGRPAIGLFSGESGSALQPLQSPLFYLRRALEPFADLSEGPPAALLRKKPGAIILADIGQIEPQTAESLKLWVEDGGLLLRFAGPHMAASRNQLIPVALRSGDRAVGGALSWEKPQSLGSFNPDGPFDGLVAPGDVTVSRQLLAIPNIDLAEKTWARLADGTPLVTAAREGRGWIVFFHTTANADWSSLVLSGLFVDMLERLLPLAQGRLDAVFQSGGNRSLAHQALLDGFGRLEPAASGIAPIPSNAFGDVAASPQHPPGLYGEAQAPLALSLVAANGPVDADFSFKESTRPMIFFGGDARGERPLAPMLFFLMSLLIIADMLISLGLRGLLPFGRARRGASKAFSGRGLGVLAVIGLSVIGLMLGLSWSSPLKAQDRPILDEQFAIDATTSTRIAYIRTGNPEIDARSHAALYGLQRVLGLRTAVKLGKPIGLDPTRDPLALFPLVYWPITADAPALDAKALDNLSRFLRNGGIVLMDTGIDDSTSDPLGLENPAAREALQRTVGMLDLPQLLPVDPDHVLARSFYLLDDFPGRLAGRTLWATRDSFGKDALVSPILIGGHDWASAWALDEFDHFIVPRLPGGARQRELAFRFGVNLVMYALTGTYKADQLHLPALIDRLGE
jgi:hypothetical protein